MADLYIDALATSVRARPGLQPSAGLPRRNMRRLVAHMIARDRGIPAERMHVRRPVPGDPADAADYATTRRALDALGHPDDDQPLVVVRSGPVIDPMTSPLAGTVHAVGWTGEDAGISHLAEQGGTQVFHLLAWAVPEDRGATVVIVDDPAYVDVETEKPAFAAVALRVARTGALRIVAVGAGPPGAETPPEARHARVFRSRRLRRMARPVRGAVVRCGRARRTRAVAHRGDERHGWLLLEAVQPRELRMSSAPMGE